MNEIQDNSCENFNANEAHDILDAVREIIIKFRYAYYLNSTIHQVHLKLDSKLWYLKWYRK